MKYFEYNYKTFEGEEKTLKLRLVSGDMKAIEKNTGVPLTEYVSGFSITMVVNMLYYMNKPFISSFSMSNAEKLYDELIDSGLTMENIYLDIIMEALVDSGFMKREDLTKLKEDKDNSEALETITPKKKATNE